jgi:hypothetical protein
MQMCFWKIHNEDAVLGLQEPGDQNRNYLAYAETNLGYVVRLLARECRPNLELTPASLYGRAFD